MAEILSLGSGLLDKKKIVLAILCTNILCGRGKLCRLYRKLVENCVENNFAMLIWGGVGQGSKSNFKNLLKFGGCTCLQVMLKYKNLLLLTIHIMCNVINAIKLRNNVSLLCGLQHM